MRNAFFTNFFRLMMENLLRIGLLLTTFTVNIFECNYKTTTLEAPVFKNEIVTNIHFMPFTAKFTQTAVHAIQSLAQHQKSQFLCFSTKH